MSLSVIPEAFELISNSWIHKPHLVFFSPESGKGEASHCHSRSLIFYHSLCHGVWRWRWRRWSWWRYGMLCCVGRALVLGTLCEVVPKPRARSFLRYPPTSSAEDLLGKGRLWPFLPTPCPHSLVGHGVCMHWREGMPVIGYVCIMAWPR